jgi:hypothetical protein
MQPGERIAVIKRIARRLAAEDDWNEIDFTLDQFGFRTLDSWPGTQYEYVRYLLKNEPPDKIAALDQYLSGHASPDEEPWEDGRFRLFISHIANQRLAAHELKCAVAFYGVDGFEAHEDIKPGREWQRVIEAALHSCDALTALLHQGFKESSWCDQEVGFALGRGVPVVPMKIHLDPYGFFGLVQAISPGTRKPKDVARELVDIHLNDKRTSEVLTEAIVRRLMEAQSFDQANGLAKLLSEKPERVTRDQMTRLRKAQKENGQVESAFDVEHAFAKIERALAPTSPPVTSPAPWYSDEEPF